uniref:Putative secreted protein n=1 Tax=Anopheles marajoara TaxID=58244 RepID=A0A2M4CE62_9DIPT
MFLKLTYLNLSLCRLCLPRGQTDALNTNCYTQKFRSLFRSLEIQKHNSYRTTAINNSSRGRQKASARKKN